MTAVIVSDPGEGTGIDYWVSGTDQIILSKNARLLAADPIGSVAEPLPPRPDFRIWTDDFYNLLRILKI
jgi:hypothetical protein